MSETVLDVAIVIAAVMMVLAAIGCIVRLIRGPYMLDRVVALDVFAAVVVGLTILGAVRTGQAVMIDVGLAIALVSFVATMAVAHFMEERGTDDA